MKRDDRSPQAYRNDVTGEQRELLDAVRGVILDTLEAPEEYVEYGMLAYRTGYGVEVCNLAAQRHYVALYVAPEVLAQHRVALGGISCGKSCARFRSLKQFRQEAVADLLRAVVAAKG